MRPYDTNIGEFRAHYAGFFDPGFGSPELNAKNTKAVLEVRSHDVPFIIEDGQTVVLGGVFKNRTGNEVTKVPFLGDLPYIGRAFRKDVRSNTKEELLIFVTPKLINDGTSRLN